MKERKPYKHLNPTEIKYNIATYNPSNMHGD